MSGDNNNSTEAGLASLGSGLQAPQPAQPAGDQGVLYFYALGVVGDEEVEEVLSTRTFEEMVDAWQEARRADGILVFPEIGHAIEARGVQSIVQLTVVPEQYKSLVAPSAVK